MSRLSRAPSKKPSSLLLLNQVLSVGIPNPWMADIVKAEEEKNAPPDKRLAQKIEELKQLNKDVNLLKDKVKKTERELVEERKKNDELVSQIKKMERDVKDTSDKLNASQTSDQTEKRRLQEDAEELTARLKKELKNLKESNDEYARFEEQNKESVELYVKAQLKAKQALVEKLEAEVEKLKKSVRELLSAGDNVTLDSLIDPRNPKPPPPPRTNSMVQQEVARLARLENAGREKAEKEEAERKVRV